MITNVSSLKQHQNDEREENGEDVVMGVGRAGVADVEPVALGWLEGAGGLEGVSGANTDAVPYGKRSERVRFS